MIAILTMLSASAWAADMPVKAPIIPAPPPFSWIGFYIGGNLGVAWGHRKVTDLTGLTFTDRTDSALIGGGQIGFNYQMGNIVLGVEADFDWAMNNHRNNDGVAVANVGTLRVTANDRWISTVAARFGYAADQWLFYGKAGAGWVGAGNVIVANLNTGVAIAGPGHRSDTGLLLGAGIEYALASNWTLKAEYDFIALNNRPFVVPAGAPFLVGDVLTSHSRDVQEFKVGFNYLFRS